MCQLVDQDHLRIARQNRAQVHLGKGDSAVFHPRRRNDWHGADRFSGVGAAMVLDHTDHDVGTAGVPAPTLAQHGDGLANPWGGPEIHPEPPGGRSFLLLRFRRLGLDSDRRGSVGTAGPGTLFAHHGAVKILTGVFAGRCSIRAH